jgi:hypothetical protein
MSTLPQGEEIVVAGVIGNKYLMHPHDKSELLLTAFVNVSQDGGFAPFFSDA